MELALQSSLAVSVRSLGCETVFHHLRSSGTRFFRFMVASFEMVVDRVHNRNTPEPAPKKTLLKSVCARDLELRRCFERFAKDVSSSFSKSQHSSNASI